jgi:hypothetical protein
MSSGRVGAGRGRFPLRLLPGRLVACFEVADLGCDGLGEVDVEDLGQEGQADHDVGELADEAAGMVLAGLVRAVVLERPEDLGVQLADFLAELDGPGEREVGAVGAGGVEPEAGRQAPRCAPSRPGARRGAGRVPRRW